MTKPKAAGQPQLGPAQRDSAQPNTKPWWQSKTLWFNVILAGLTALEANAGLIQPYLPGNVYVFGMVLLTCGNAVLRFVTSQGVSLK